MKKIVALLVFSLPLLAGAAEGDKIKMVGLFPTPYMAYDQLRGPVDILRVGMAHPQSGEDPSNFMILGTQQTAHSLRVGTSSSPASLRIENSSKLQLDGPDSTHYPIVKVLSPIEGTGSSQPLLEFQRHLFVEAPYQALPGQEEHDPLGSLTSENVSVTTLSLFLKEFPACNHGDGDSYGKIRWGKFKREDDPDHKARIYLFCGNLPVQDGNDCPNCWKWNQVGECSIKAVASCQNIAIHAPVGSECTQGGQEAEAGYKSCTESHGGRPTAVHCPKWTCEQDRACMESIQGDMECLEQNKPH